jgi:hypothetical protein
MKNFALMALLANTKATKLMAHAEVESMAALPQITQKKVARTCDGSLNRLLRERDGNVKVEGTKFVDTSFPADASSIAWRDAKYERKDWNSFKWMKVTDQVRNPSLYGSKGVKADGVQ